MTDNTDFNGHIADEIRDACLAVIGRVVTFDASRQIAERVVQKFVALRMIPNPNPSPELLPCPFCGGEAAIQLDRGRDTVGVCCTKCTACQPPSWDIDSETWARRAWNTRAVSPQTLPAPGEVERKVLARVLTSWGHADDARAALRGAYDETEAMRQIVALATVAAANDEGVRKAFDDGFEAGMDAETFMSRGLSSDKYQPPLTAPDAWAKRCKLSEQPKSGSSAALIALLDDPKIAAAVRVPGEPQK